MALLRCTDAYAYTDHKSGQNRVVRYGDLLHDNDPRVKGREEWFEVVEETAEKVTPRPAPVPASDAEPASRRTRRTKE